MKRRSMKYIFVSLILVMAMFLTPMAPAIRLHQATMLWETMTQAAMPQMSVPTAHAEEPGSNTIYLPIAITAGDAPPPAAPAFEIISPVNEGAISGMMYFAVQPTDAATLSSVTFKAGSTDLGTDSDGSNGFKVYLNASDLPAGTLELSAIGTGPSGETTKRISVNVVPNPPSSGTVNSQGGVLASEIGSVITLPPDAVPNGTNISVTEMTQEEVTTENGFDWDAMGVTFLGAQKIESNADISKPLGVASAGFGNRVQPGQAVVNYRIAPDADGDGVDELIVVNTASVAPNGDVISDPVPQAQVSSATTRSRSGSSFVRNLNGGISGPPGTVIDFQTTGFNPASAFGNLAIFRSLVDGEIFEVHGVVYADPEDASAQTFKVLIPPLTPGQATLTLRNESTGSLVGPIDLTVKATRFSNIAPTKTIDTFLSQSITFVSNLPASVTDAATFRDQGIAELAEVRELFQQAASDPDPNVQQALIDIAMVIENSDILTQLSSESRTIETLSQSEIVDLNVIEAVLLTVIGVILLVKVSSVLTAIVALASLGVALIKVYEIFENSINVEPSFQGPRMQFNPFGATGMGAALPPGGDAGGTVVRGPDAGGLRSASGLEPGRFVIKVLSGASSIPFSGVTDAGGYFFIPLIPQGEPFTAIAFDTTTGQTRTFEGIGPAIGESTFMFFDFINEGQPVGTPIEIGDVVNGEISEAGELDLYSFEATAGQQVYFDGQGTSASFLNVDWRLLDPQGKVIFNRGNFGDAGSYTLQTGGTYTLVVSGSGDTTSTYQFQLWNVPPPDEFTINIGDVVSNGNPAAGAGNIETPGVIDIYRFEATAGQQVYFDGQGTSASFLNVEWRLLDSQETVIFNKGDFGDPGIHTLQKGGTYTLLVFGSEDTMSTYQFQLWNVPPSDEFTINIGDVVSDGNPAAGAGNIETPGVIDIYRFEATAGQQVYFDGQGTSASFLNVEWRLLDSQGTVIFNKGDFGDHGPYTLDAGGTYSLFVDGSGDTISTYQFQMRDKSQVSTQNSTVPISR